MIFKQTIHSALSVTPIEALTKVDGFEAMTLADLFYELSLAEPTVSLATGLSAESIYYIKQWPNMGNSRHAKAMVKMAAYFSKQQATLSKAAHDLSLELNQIMAFINAVHSQNLLMSVANQALPKTTIPELAPKIVEDTKQAPPPPKSNAVGGLFSRIRQRLGI